MFGGEPQPSDRTWRGGTRHPQNGQIQPLWPKEPLALKPLHCITMPSKRLVRNSDNTMRSPQAPSGAERHCSLRHYHLWQALPEGHGAGLDVVNIFGGS